MAKHVHVAPGQHGSTATGAQPSIAPGSGRDEDDRRIRRAFVDYFRLLQEWSMKANPMARSVAMSRRLLKFGGGSVTTTRPDDPLDYECATVITTFPFLCALAQRT